MLKLNIFVFCVVSEFIQCIWLWFNSNSGGYELWGDGEYEFWDVVGSGL